MSTQEAELYHPTTKREQTDLSTSDVDFDSPRGVMSTLYARLTFNGVRTKSDQVLGSNATHQELNNDRN